MLRVIHLASGDLWAGAEVQLFHLVVALSKKNVNVLVVLLNDGELADNLRKQNIGVKIISEEKYGLIRLLVLFKSIVSEFKPCVVHTHRTKENLIGGLVARLYQVDSVRTVHGALENNAGFKQWLLKRLDIFISKYCQSAIVAVSDELNEKLQSDYPSEKIVTINNSINVEYVVALSKEQNDNLVGKEKFNIMLVGRLVPVKRVDYFIEVIELLSKKYKRNDFCAYIAGDGPLREDLKQVIANKNLTSVVRMVGFKRNIAPLLKQMDLLAITSDHEGLPMTLLEAMALEVPVLSRHLATVKHVLCDGGCGLVMHPDAEAVEMAKIMDDIISDKDILPELSMSAFENLKENYSIEGNVALYMRLYE